jgi:hypothetical protein
MKSVRIAARMMVNRRRPPPKPAKDENVNDINGNGDFGDYGTRRQLDP